MIGGKEERNGYLIEEEKGYYKVTRSDGSSWTEDTHEEAVKSIEEEIIEAMDQTGLTFEEIIK